jgi:hypothetical protein
MSAEELFVPPGHFYSPIFLPNQEFRVSPAPSSVEISMHASEQIDLLEKISSLGTLFSKESDSSNFYFSNNDQYGDGDAFCYSGMVKHLKPTRIIEIGSGYSTAVLLDTLRNEGMGAELLTIDPFPQRFQDLLDSKSHLVPKNVKVSTIPKRVQDVDLNIYSDLKRNDILFIDSSHVSKTGSDVNFELFEIFPLLRSGVWVHIHDMFWPFEYPVEWVRQGRSWNENYLIRAYLTGNSNLKVRFFQQYLYNVHNRDWQRIAAKGVGNPGGGLWLEIC